MLIIDDNRDYYDYACPHLIDKKIVFHRNSQVTLGHELYFNPEPFHIDRDKWWSKYRHQWECEQWHFGLYVGYEYYKFIVGRYFEKRQLVLEYMQATETDKERRERESLKRPSNAAILLVSPYGMYDDALAGRELCYTRERIEYQLIENPILKKTWLTKELSPESVWTNVYNYLVATKDEPVQDSRTNDEKVLSAGFDLRSSFRNVK
ncbi:MAG: hypothetical protein IKU03_02565 [Bacteroidales bacterium]|nr:hypothetical protein [Bacteroidales bacterium]